MVKTKMARLGRETASEGPEGRAWARAGLALLLFLSGERSQGLLAMEKEHGRHWLRKSWSWF